jgi:hypothetical protein
MRPWAILFLLVPWVTLAVVCESEDAAFQLFSAALLSTPPGRFVVRGYSLADLRDLTIERYHLIQSVSDQQAAQQSAAQGDDDAMRFLYDADVLVNLTRMTYDAEQANADCLALTTTPSIALSLLSELRDTTNAFIITSTLVALQNNCGDNEVLTWDASGNVYECSCADGEVCAAETNDDLLERTVLYLIMGLNIGAILMLVAMGVLLLRQATGMRTTKKMMMKQDTLELRPLSLDK